MFFSVFVKRKLKIQKCRAVETLCFQFGEKSQDTILEWLHTPEVR